MQSKNSILVYCGDVVGLGHLRRNTAILSRLVRDQPRSNVLLLSNLPTANLFECPPGVDAISLPSLRRTEGGDVVARKLTVETEQVRRVRMSIIDAVAKSFRPDLLLADHLPTGVWDELLPTLASLKASDRPPSIVLGVRDILDLPIRMVDRWRRRGVYRAIEEFYDEVLVYGTPEVFDAAEHYRLRREVSTPITSCGYVCAGNGPGNGSTNRERLGLSAGELVVVTAGGGADGFPMMKLCLDSIRRLEPRADRYFVCITGPLMNREQVDELRRLAEGLPVRMLWCVEAAPKYFAAADLIVTMAGYNTLVEAIRLKKRTLVLPRSGPSAEQETRTEIFSRLGLVRGVRPSERTPERLARLIPRMLNAEIPTADLPDMDGLNTAASRLGALLAERNGARSASGGGA